MRILSVGPDRSLPGATVLRMRFRHITLDMLAAALPFDWRVCIEKSGPLSWVNLVATAYARAAEIGVTEAIWAEAQSELGRAGAAILVLLADADSVERRGTIRCPAAWVRAMAARAETDSLRLRRNLFGLRNAVESTPARPGPEFPFTSRRGAHATHPDSRSRRPARKHGSSHPPALGRGGL